MMNLLVCRAVQMERAKEQDIDRIRHDAATSKHSDTQALRLNVSEYKINYQKNNSDDI